MSSIKKTEGGQTWYFDGEFWLSERDVCHYCREECERNCAPYRENHERTSFGVYAGRMCDECWKTSGYRDATDPDATFDPDYAGERLEAED